VKTNRQAIQVAAGLICRDGRYLITRRNAGTHLEGLWEFPGGKREAGETLQACLQRELREELGIEITTPLPFRVIRHEYPEKRVELYFFFCSIAGGEPQLLGCAEAQWVSPKELDRFEFPPADQPLLKILQDPTADVGNDGELRP
jgi:8-oxo-dGTP diphosphatase